MFKLFEKDKCKSIPLDTSTVLENTPGHNLADIAPGMMMYLGEKGAVPAANTTGSGPYSVTEGNAGRFFISNDYYNNTTKSSITNTTVPVVPNTPIPSGMLAGIPILEKFDMELPLAMTLEKGDLLSYVEGEWDKAASTELAFAMVTENNGTYTNTPLTTKITTWMHVHKLA